MMRERNVPDAVDASVFGGEFVDAAVHVATGGFRRGGAHDPLQT
jgi:hypothetical protein